MIRYRVLDCVSVIVEFAIGTYLYKENKQSLSLNMILGVDYVQFLYEIIYIAMLALLSVTIMLLLYTYSQQCLRIFTCILAIYMSKINLISILLIPVAFRCQLGNIDDDVLHAIYTNKLPLLIFVIYHLSSVFVSTSILQLVFVNDFVGFKQVLFIYMNIVFFFNIIEKTTANMILFLFMNDVTFLRKTWIRTIIMSCIATSSLVKLGTYCILSNGKGNLVVAYALVHNKSCVEAILDLSRMPHVKYVSTKWLMYVYTTVAFLFVRQYCPLNFFHTYQFFVLFIRIHMAFIETYFSIHIYLSVINEINKHKPSQHD